MTNTGVNEKQFGIRFGRNIITQKWAVGYTYFQKTVGILSAHIGNVGDLYRAISSGIPFRINPFSRTINSPKQHTQHHTLKLNYQKTFDNGNRIETAYAFQSNKRQEFDVRRGVPSTVPALDIHLQTHSFLVDLLSAQKETMSWAVGTSLSFQDNFSDPDTGVKRLIPDYFRTQTGAYLTATYFPSNNFQLEGGIRYDLDWLNAKKFLPYLGLGRKRVRPALCRYNYKKNQYKPIPYRTEFTLWQFLRFYWTASNPKRCDRDQFKLWANQQIP